MMAEKLIANLSVSPDKLIKFSVCVEQELRGWALGFQSSGAFALGLSFPEV